MGIPTAELHAICHLLRIKADQYIAVTKDIVETANVMPGNPRYEMLPVALNSTDCTSI